MSKFDNSRDALLHVMSLEGWANESGGNVECATGYYARISNDRQDIESIRDAFPSESSDVSDADMVGHFLYQENSQGFVFVSEYPDSVSLIRDFRILEREFSEWDNQE